MTTINGKLMCNMSFSCAIERKDILLFWCYRSTTTDGGIIAIIRLWNNTITWKRTRFVVGDGRNIVMLLRWLVGGWRTGALWQPNEEEWMREGEERWSSLSLCLSCHVLVMSCRLDRPVGAGGVSLLAAGAAVPCGWSFALSRSPVHHITATSHTHICICPLSHFTLSYSFLSTTTNQHLFVLFQSFLSLDITHLSFSLKLLIN
jgi:hypothetical protein